MIRYFVTYTGYASNLVGPSPAGFPGSTFVDRETTIVSLEDKAAVEETIRLREKLARVVVMGWKKVEEE